MLDIKTFKSALEQFLNAEKESEIIKILIEQAVQMINSADGCVLHHFEPQFNNLFPIAGVKASVSGKLIPWETPHIHTHYPGQSTMQIGTGIAGQALYQREVIYAPDVTNHPWFEKSASAFHR